MDVDHGNGECSTGACVWQSDDPDSKIHEDDYIKVADLVTITIVLSSENLSKLAAFTAGYVSQRSGSLFPTVKNPTSQALISGYSGRIVYPSENNSIVLIVFKSNVYFFIN